MDVLPVAHHVAMADHAHVAAVHLADHVGRELAGGMRDRLPIDANHPLDSDVTKPRSCDTSTIVIRPASCAKLVEEPGLDQRIDVGRRLVQEQQFGLAAEGPGDEHPLPLPAGERGEVPPSERRPCGPVRAPRGAAVRSLRPYQPSQPLHAAAAKPAHEHHVHHRHRE